MSEKQYVMVRLNPPRPTFPTDMTEKEAAAMAEHSRYWRGLLADGKAVAFGPVLDPAGVWGLGLLEVDDPADAEKITAADPAVVGGVVRTDTFPMLSAIVRPHRESQP
jgi:uncharacterized protein YciI